MGVRVPRRAEGGSGNALGLRVLQGFGPGDDGRKTGGPGLTGLETDGRVLLKTGVGIIDIDSAHFNAHHDRDPLCT